MKLLLLICELCGAFVAGQINCYSGRLYHRNMMVIPQTEESHNGCEFRVQVGINSCEHFEVSGRGMRKPPRAEQCRLEKIGFLSQLVCFCKDEKCNGKAEVIRAAISAANNSAVDADLYRIVQCTLDILPQVFPSSISSKPTSPTPTPPDSTAKSTSRTTRRSTKSTTKYTPTGSRPTMTSETKLTASTSSTPSTKNTTTVTSTSSSTGSTATSTSSSTRTSSDTHVTESSTITTTSADAGSGAQKVSIAAALIGSQGNCGSSDSMAASSTLYTVVALAAMVILLLVVAAVGMFVVFKKKITEKERTKEVATQKKAALQKDLNELKKKTGSQVERAPAQESNNSTSDR